jgi:hypothetical protein
LEGARLKLDRARIHLAELKKAFDEFLDHGGVTVTFDPDQAPSPETPFRLHAEEPPKSISLIVGDCVHNIRSSLDHLVYALALHKRDGRKPRKKTQFPIATTVVNYFTKGRHDVRVLDPRHRRVIRLIQPYQQPDPQEHWLTALNRLSNQDKHRLLNLSLHRVEQMSYRIKETDTAYIVFVGGIRVVSAHTDIEPLKADPHVTAIIRMGLSFGSPRNDEGRLVLRIGGSADESVVAILGTLIAETEIILDWFEPIVRQ